MSVEFLGKAQTESVGVNKKNFPFLLKKVYDFLSKKFI